MRDTVLDGTEYFHTNASLQHPTPLLQVKQTAMSLWNKSISPQVISCIIKTICHLDVLVKSLRPLPVKQTAAECIPLHVTCVCVDLQPTHNVLCWQKVKMVPH